MTIHTPGFFGLILRKNGRTRAFIEQETQCLLKHFPQIKLIELNEDDHIVGFSVAMNGRDLGLAIEDLRKEGAVHGKDFVATSSHEGVIDPMPSWLVAASGPSSSELKSYSIAPGHERPENDA